MRNVTALCNMVIIGMMIERERSRRASDRGSQYMTTLDVRSASACLPVCGCRSAPCGHPNLLKTDPLKQVCCDVATDLF